MRQFVTASVVLATAAAGIYLLLTHLEAPEAVSVSVFPCFATLIPVLYQVLQERADQSNIRHSRRALPGLAEFGVHPFVMFLYTLGTTMGALYGFCVLFFAVNLFLHQETPWSDSRLLVGASLLSCVMVFWAGRWSGKRCRGSWWSALVGVSAFPTLWFIIYLWKLAFDPEPRLFEPQWLQGTAKGLAALVLIGTLGLWIGRRRRPLAYVSYMLESLPKDAKATIVELMVEESRRALGSTSTRPNRVAREVALPSPHTT